MMQISCRHQTSKFKWRVYQPQGDYLWRAEIFKTTDKHYRRPIHIAVFRLKREAYHWAETECDRRDS